MTLKPLTSSEATRIKWNIKSVLVLSSSSLALSSLLVGPFLLLLVGPFLLLLVGPFLLLLTDAFLGYPCAGDPPALPRRTSLSPRFSSPSFVMILAWKRPQPPSVVSLVG